MKVLFLDIDGVLIHHKSIPIHTARKPDPACVKRLNEITDRTGTKIVVSSTWRMFEDFHITLKSWGVTAEVIGKTPISYEKGRISLGATRGAEINTWLGETEFDIERFVILDDNNDVDPLLGSLVHTSMSTGLTELHVELAIRKLGGTV
jgi:hypothetical protein